MTRGGSHEGEGCLNGVYVFVRFGSVMPTVAKNVSGPCTLHDVSGALRQFASVNRRKSLVKPSGRTYINDLHPKKV